MKYLQVDVILDKNWAVLFTQRLEVQQFGILLSNLSGSILGILGIIGFLMSLFEDLFIKFENKRKYKLNIAQIMQNRGHLLHENFEVLNNSDHHINSVIAPIMTEYMKPTKVTKVHDISWFTSSDDRRDHSQKDDSLSCSQIFQVYHDL
jgi:hypothetical protein